jgi:hypothetical protein
MISPEELDLGENCCLCSRLLQSKRDKGNCLLLKKW